MLEEKLSPRQRQWLYGVGVAAVGLLVTYKIIEPEHAPMWLDMFVNVVGIGAPGVATGTAAVVLNKQRRDGTLE